MLWSNAIGFSVYAFEGVGMVLPVREVAADQENYFKVLCATLLFIGSVYIAFPELCLWAFSPQAITSPLITDNLPPYSWWTWVIKILFAINLVISYPLIIHPANCVLESYLFAGWAKTRKRQMGKNVSRSLVVFVSCVIAIAVYEKLDKLLALTGAVTCTPIAFTFPAAFHLKVCATSMKDKIIDSSIIIMSLVIIFYVGYTSILNFNHSD